MMYHLLTVSWTEDHLCWSWENIVIDEDIVDWLLDMQAIEGRTTILHNAIEITQDQHDKWKEKYG